MKKKYRKAVFIVCYRKEKNSIKYLLLKRKLHWRGWEFPKGGIKKIINKEVVREIKEETGQKPLKIKRYKVSGKYRYKREFADRPGIIGQTYILFSAQIKKQKIKLDKLEHSAYKWLDYNQALKKLTWDHQKKCLRYINKRINLKN